MQVADTAARGFSLTGDLPVVFKQIVQRDKHGFEIEMARVAPSSAAHTDRGQSPCSIVCAYIATAYKRTPI
jgi:hypothetical protein